MERTSRAGSSAMARSSSNPDTFTADTTVITPTLNKYILQCGHWFIHDIWPILPRNPLDKSDKFWIWLMAHMSLTEYCIHTMWTWVSGYVRRPHGLPDSIGIKALDIVLQLPQQVHPRGQPGLHDDLLEAANFTRPTWVKLLVSEARTRPTREWPFSYLDWMCCTREM